MYRVLNLVSVIALLAAAVGVYQLKYSSTFEAQKIAKVREDIRAEHDRIAILNAEWARRTAPDRVQALAEHHLDMQPLDVEHMDTLANLPAKSNGSSDALGGMIEALVDGPLNTGSLGAPEKAKPTTRPASPMVSAPGAAPAAPRLPSAGSSTGAAAPRPAVQANRAPLPLSAMPSAGVMGSASGAGMPAPVRPPMMSAPVTSATPLLPPASVGD